MDHGGYHETRRVYPPIVNGFQGSGIVRPQAGSMLIWRRQNVLIFEDILTL